MYSFVHVALSIFLHYVRQPRFDHDRCENPIQARVPVMLKCEEVIVNGGNGFFLQLEKEVQVMFL